MRLRDLIEHNVKTKLSGPDRSKLRSNVETQDEEQEQETAVLDLGVFDAPTLHQGSPPGGDGTTPGATAAPFQTPAVAPAMYEARRFLELITEVSFMTHVSVIAKQTGTNVRDWEKVDGPQIGPGKDYWYAHKTTNQIVQVSVERGKASFFRTTEEGDPIDAWELT